MIEMKVKIGWVVICPIMIYEGEVIPRRLGLNKILYHISKWMMNIAVICLYIVGINKLKRNPFLKITGERTIYIEE